MLLCTIALSFVVTSSLGARILGVVPVPSYSHQIVFRPLWRELSLRGHQVTVLTTDPMNNASLTNLTEIDLHFSYEHWKKFNFVDVSQSNIIFMFHNALKISNDIIDEQLQHPDVQKLIKNENEHFDLVMVECFYPGMFAFAERFKSPFIGLFSLDASSDVYELIGNPTHPVLYPDFTLPHAGELTFLERLANTLLSQFVKHYFTRNNFNQQHLLIKKHFGDDYPPLYDIFKNVSLLFVNTDPIFHQIRPLLPSVVQIGGGTHLKPAKPLPKDLQRQLDNATQGFIYFSLGSNVKSRELSDNVRNIILETFSELPHLVLWKFELENLPGKPDNVIISKWFPQEDIFRHPHIKLFITQGGLQSMEEAIYNHIPLVGMPFFGDQPNNVKKIVAKGIGLSVDYQTLDKQNLKSTVLEVISNPLYRNKVKELEQLAKDQPMTGLERALWWTEYVLRHNGVQHLRSPAADIPLYQYLLLDVIGFCLVVLSLAIYLIILVIKFSLKMFKCYTSKPKVKVQ